MSDREAADFSTPSSNEDSRATTKKRLLVASHCVVGLLIIFVATWNIGTADAAPDEYAYRDCAHRYIEGIFSCNREHPLLAKEIIGILGAPFGTSIDAARLVTALFAIATAAFCYLFVTDCTDRVGGLIAAAAWGLLPQAGVEGATTLEAIRIDRFGLLDPYVACFIALALWTGWRWTTRGGALWAALTGAACVAAACSKAPGAFAVPVICLVPLVARRHNMSVRRELPIVLGAGAIVFIASYAPLGPARAASAIAYMFKAQTAHASSGMLVEVANHLYLHTPWWSDIAFAISGLTWPIALVLGIFLLVGMACFPKPGAYALCACASIFIGVGVGLHLSLPHYWIDWEPGVIVVASLGIRSLFAHKRLIFLAAALALVLVGGAIWTIGNVATLQVGPYQEIAKAASCEHPCVVQFAGYDDILINYVSTNDAVVLGPPHARSSVVSTGIMVERSDVRVRPALIVIDPNALVLHPKWTKDAKYFEARANHLGYRRVPTKGRIKVWTLIK